MNTLKINDVVNEKNNDINNNNDVNMNDLKNKNKEYEEQIKKLKEEIEEYKNKIKNNIELDPKKFEELRHQNLLLYNKLQEAQKKILQANSLVGKAKRYNLCAAYVSQLLGLIKPENDKQSSIITKLKTIIEEDENKVGNKKYY